MKLYCKCLFHHNLETCDYCNVTNPFPAKNNSSYTNHSMLMLCNYAIVSSPFTRSVACEVLESI